jgi:flagellar biosynthesis component FlhA
MIRYLLSKVGCLMVLVGGILLLLGVAGERSGQPAFDYLMIGVILTLVGLLLWQRLRPKRERPTRFSILRKRSKEQDEDHHSQENWEDNHYV